MDTVQIRFGRPHASLARIGGADADEATPLSLSPLHRPAPSPVRRASTSRATMLDAEAVTAMRIETSVACRPSSGFVPTVVTVPKVTRIPPPRPAAIVIPTPPTTPFARAAKAKPRRVVVDTPLSPPPAVLYTLNQPPKRRRSVVDAPPVHAEVEASSFSREHLRKKEHDRWTAAVRWLKDAHYADAQTKEKAASEAAKRLHLVDMAKTVREQNFKRFTKQAPAPPKQLRPSRTPTAVVALPPKKPPVPRLGKRRSTKSAAPPSPVSNQQEMAPPPAPAVPKRKKRPVATRKPVDVANTVDETTRASLDARRATARVFMEQQKQHRDEQRRRERQLEAEHARARHAKLQHVETVRLQRLRDSVALAKKTKYMETLVRTQTQSTAEHAMNLDLRPPAGRAFWPTEVDNSDNGSVDTENRSDTNPWPISPPNNPPVDDGTQSEAEHDDESDDASNNSSDDDGASTEPEDASMLRKLYALKQLTDSLTNRLSQLSQPPIAPPPAIVPVQWQDTATAEMEERIEAALEMYAPQALPAPFKPPVYIPAEAAVPSSVSSSASSLDARAFYRPTLISQEAPDASDRWSTTERVATRMPVANNQETSEDDDSDGAPSWRRRPSLVDERPTSAWRVSPMLPPPSSAFQRLVRETDDDDDDDLDRLIAASRDAYSVVDMFAQELLRQQQDQQALRSSTPRFEAVEDIEDDHYQEQRRSSMTSPDDSYLRFGSGNYDGVDAFGHDDCPAAYSDRAHILIHTKGVKDGDGSDEDARNDGIPNDGARDGMAQYTVDPDVEALLSEAHRILSREASETTPPRAYWDHMLLEDDEVTPALHRRPRVTIVTEEEDAVVAQRRQFSPRTLSRQLLAAVEFQETLHEAQMHLESLEHAHDVQEAQDETLDWSHSVRADVDHLCESHAFLQDTLAYQSQLHDENLLRQARDLLEARLQAQRDTAVQTEAALRHDAGTEATWRQDAGTMAVEARDGGTQFALRLSVAVQSDAPTVDAEAATPAQWAHVEPTTDDDDDNDDDYGEEETSTPKARSAGMSAEVESAVNESQVYSDAFEASVARPASVVDNSVVEDDEDLDDDAAPGLAVSDGDEVADDDVAYSEGFESPRKSSMAGSIIEDEDENDGGMADTTAVAVASDDIDDAIVDEDDAPLDSGDVNDATVEDDDVPIYSDGFESPGKPPVTSTPTDEDDQVGEDDAYSEAFSSPRKPMSVADSVHDNSASGSPRHASVVGSVADDAYSEAFESPRKGSIATSVPDDEDVDVGSFESPLPVHEAHETAGAPTPTLYTPLPSYAPSLAVSATPSPRVEAYLSSLAQRDAAKAQYIRHILVRKASEDKLLELRYARLTTTSALSAWQVEMEKLHLDGARTANVAKCYEDMMCYPPESQDEVRVLAEAFGGSFATWTPALAPPLEPPGPPRPTETTVGSTHGSNEYADEFEATSKDASNEVLEDDKVVEASAQDDDYNDDASVPDDDASVPDDDASVPDDEGTPPGVEDETSTKDEIGLESGVVEDAIADVETAARDDDVPDDMEMDQNDIDDDASAKEDAEIYSSDNFAAPSEDVVDVSEAPVAEDDDPVDDVAPVDDAPDDVGVSGVYSDDDFDEHKSTVDEASHAYSVDGFEAPTSVTDASAVDVPSASLPADPLVDDDAPVEASEPKDDIADVPSETSEVEGEVEDDHEDDALVADEETTAQDDGEYSQDEFASGSAPLDTPVVASEADADVDDGYGDDFESSSKSGSGEAASNTSEQLRRALDELQQTHPRLVSAEEDAKYTRRKLQALALLEAKKSAIVAGTKLSELAAIDHLVTYSLQLNVHDEIQKQTPVFVPVAQDAATPLAAPAIAAVAPEPDDYSDSFNDDEELADGTDDVAENVALPDEAISSTPEVAVLASSLDEGEQRLQALQEAVAAKQQEAMAVQALVAKEERKILIHETIETLQVQLDQTERLVVSEADRLAALQATAKDLAIVDNAPTAQADVASDDEVAGSQEGDACNDASLDESFSSEKAAPVASASMLALEESAENDRLDNDDDNDDLLANDEDGSVELSVVDGESLSDVDVADASFGSQDDDNDDEPSIVATPLALDVEPTIDVAPTVPRLAATPQVLDDSFSSVVDDEPLSVDLLDGFDVVEAALPANWFRETSVQTVATMETLDYIEVALTPVRASADNGDTAMASMDYVEDAEVPTLATARSYLDTCDHIELAESATSAAQTPMDAFASYDHIEVATPALPLSTTDVWTNEPTSVVDAEHKDDDSADDGSADLDAFSDQLLLGGSAPLEDDIVVHHEIQVARAVDIFSQQYDYVEVAQAPRALCSPSSNDNAVPVSVTTESDAVAPLASSSFAVGDVGCSHQRIDVLANFSHVEAAEAPAHRDQSSWAIPSTPLDAYDHVEQAQAPTVSVTTERVEELPPTPHVDIDALVSTLWHNLEQDVWADVLRAATAEAPSVEVNGEVGNDTTDELVTETPDPVDRLVDDIFRDVMDDALLSLRRPGPRQTTVARPSTPPTAPVFKVDTLRDMTAFKTEYTLMTQARQAFDWRQIDAALVDGVDIELPASTLTARRRLMQDWQRESAPSSARPLVDNVPKSVKELLLNDTSDAAVASVTSRLVKGTADSEARIVDAIWRELCAEAVGGSLRPALDTADT